MNEDVNELTEVIARYHVNLGFRMVADKGKNEKVSPSRELANTILNAGYISRKRLLSVEDIKKCIESLHVIVDDSYHLKPEIRHMFSRAIHDEQQRRLI